MIKKSYIGFIALVSLTNCIMPALAATSLMKQDDLLKSWKLGGLTAAKSGPVITLTSPHKMAHFWSAQAGFNPKVALRKGDTITVKFSIRATKPASGGQVIFGVAGGEKYQPQGGKDLKLTSKLQKISMSFPVKGDYAAGKWQVTFALGSLAQTVQISDLSLVKK